MNLLGLELPIELLYVLGWMLLVGLVFLEYLVFERRELLLARWLALWVALPVFLMLGDRPMAARISEAAAGAVFGGAFLLILIWLLSRQQKRRLNLMRRS